MTKLEGEERERRLPEALKTAAAAPHTEVSPDVELNTGSANPNEVEALFEDLNSVVAKANEPGYADRILSECSDWGQRTQSQGGSRPVFGILVAPPIYALLAVLGGVANPEQAKGARMAAEEAVKMGISQPGEMAWGGVPIFLSKGVEYIGLGFVSMTQSGYESFVEKMKEREAYDATRGKVVSPTTGEA